MNKDLKLKILDSQGEHMYRSYYKYKNKIYGFIGMANHKNEQTREWEAVAIYQSEDGIIYTRNFQEFSNRFSTVDYDSEEVKKFHSNRHLRYI